MGAWTGRVRDKNISRLTPEAQRDQLRRTHTLNTSYVYRPNCNRKFLISIARSSRI